jgi:hypothetical protein
VNVAGRPVADVLSRSYLVAGVPFVVTATDPVLEYVDETYGAYRVDALERDPYLLNVDLGETGYVLSDSEGRMSSCPDEEAAALDALRRLVLFVTDRLGQAGIYATHAGSLVHEGRSLILVGKTRSGKTTLTLALVSRGLGFLSDEFALSAPDARTILPYRRGLHIRPGTPELIGEIAFIRERPHRPVGGGLQWTLSPEELERTFPSCLAEPAPLRHVVLLEPRTGATSGVLEPVSPGVVTVELVRATTIAATDFDGAMERAAKLTQGARCVRLRQASLASSVELLLTWLAEDDD